MKVMKFGGTSVGKPERMHQVAQLILRDDEPKIVVLSALSGTTNTLVAIGEYMSKGERETARQQIQKFHEHYQSFINGLLATETALQKANLIVDEHLEFLNIILKISFNQALNKDILAQGELLSTKLFSVYLEEQGIEHVLLPALDFMVIDTYDEPQIGSIKVKLTQLLKQHSEKNSLSRRVISAGTQGERLII